jgi:hypothetical protein
MAAVSAAELVESEDRWEVPLDGTLEQVRADHALTLVVDGERGAFEIAIEQPFALERAGDGTTEVGWPDDMAAVAPVLALLHGGVEAAVAFKDGRLELRLAGGACLRVAAGEDFEPWTLVGPGGLRLVSVPGGELAVWSPTA